MSKETMMPSPAMEEGKDKETLKAITTPGGITQSEEEKILKQAAINKRIEEDEGKIKTTKTGIMGKLKNLFADKPVDQAGAMNIINGHPAKKMMYEQMLKSDPMKAGKYMEFIKKNPSNKYSAWDDKKQEFVDTTRYTVASGETGSYDQYGQ